ncbi:MAG: PIN domain-containing protein [Gemmatimonadaceae bacterium]|nr:PIN domain-containing protein [Gemmatimonadaceae bacterium]
MRVTVDASVWLSALSPAEREHRACATLIRTLVERRVPMHQPGLFIVEVCATMARRTHDRALAIEAGRLALESPAMVMHELDHQLAAAAAEVAATCALRGADAVYVATASKAASTLLTLDHEVRERAAARVDVRTVSEWQDVLR